MQKQSLERNTNPVKNDESNRDLLEIEKKKRGGWVYLGREMKFRFGRETKGELGVM